MAAFCSGTTAQGKNCRRGVSRPGAWCGQCKPRASSGTLADRTFVGQDIPLAADPIDHPVPASGRCVGLSCDRQGEPTVAVSVDDGYDVVEGRCCEGCVDHFEEYKTTWGLCYQLLPRPQGTFVAGDHVESLHGDTGTFVGWKGDGQQRAAVRLNSGHQVAIRAAQLAHPFRHHPRWDDTIEAVVHDMDAQVPTGAADGHVARVAQETGNRTDVLFALAVNEAASRNAAEHVTA